LQFQNPSIMLSLFTFPIQRAEISKLTALSSLFFVLAFAGLQAQTNSIYFEDWVNSGGSSPVNAQSEFFARIATTNDASGNLFVASSSFNNTTQVHDLLVEKSNPTGTKIWSTHFNISGGGDILVGDLVLDNNGSPIVTGAVLNGTNNYDVLTVKFTAAGAVSWNATWNGSGNGYDGGASVTCDASGNIFIARIAQSSLISWDFLTIKYTTGGTKSWQALYDHAGFVDAAAKITHDNGIVRVFGGVQVNPNTWALGVVRYDATTGSQIAVNLISNNILFNEINGFANDANKNTYFVGSRNNNTGGSDFLTVKVASDMTVAWETTWNLSGGKDAAKAVAIDANGNVFVTGHTTTNGNGQDYATLKFNSSGSLAWSKTYNGAANLDDKPTDVAVDNNGNIFVTGFANEKSNEDFVTIWYDTNGNEKWVGRFNSVYNQNDKSANIQIDPEGGLLVTGRTGKSQNDGTSITETTTVRYRRSCDYIIPPDVEPQSSATMYVQNKGQLLKTDGSLATEIVYYSEANSPWLTFQADKINLITTDLNGGGNDRSHRVDMAFGSDSRYRKLFALEERPDYFNFYLPHIPQGREFVPAYQRLIYCEAFEGVDLEMSSNSAGVKYYYVVKPGGDPNKIRLDMSGQTGMSISGGDLHISTSLGDIVMPHGIAFQVDGSGNYIPLSWSPNYVITGNSFGFSVGSFNPAWHLVIEVLMDNCMATNGTDNLKWATFYGTSGETSEEFYHDISNDGSNVFVCGETHNPSFPFSTGLNFGITASLDAFVVKFDINGTRQWSTRIGGSEKENGVGIFAESSGNTFLGGKTTSSDFPDKNDGLNWFSGSLAGGGQDAFIAKFNSAGVLQFASYFGSDDLEAASVITKSLSGKFYVAGAGKVPAKNTDSSPMAVAPGGGSAFIARFSSDFKTHEWSSQYGLVGGGADVMDMETDASNNIFITGLKQASSVEVFGSGAVATHSGGNDAFIAKISAPPHSLLYSSNYGGSGNEQGNGIALDNQGNVFVCGETTTTGSISDWNTSGTGVGGADGFILKFSNSMGTPSTARIIGANKEDRFLDIGIDGNNLPYFIGKTASTNLTVVNPTTFFTQSANGDTNANPDIWLVRMNNALSGNPIWNTYMGYKPGEEGTAMTILKSSNQMFITGNSGHSALNDVFFPLRPGKTTAPKSYFDCTLGTMATNQDGIICKFDLGTIVGIEETNLEKTSIKLFPNPTDGQVFLQSDLLKPFRVHVFSTTGVEVFRTALQGHTSTIDLSHLAKGAYFIRIMSEDESFSEILIIN
jgi:Secretion system C-terminal sorting domain/Beta-propeller repeat